MHSRAIVHLLFCLNLKTTKITRPVSANRRKGNAVGSAYGNPNVSAKINGIARIMPCKRIRQ
jgi:hypothetical protein